MEEEDPRIRELTFGKCREKWARPTPDNNKLATIFYIPPSPTPSERKEDLFGLSNLAIESYNSKHLEEDPRIKELTFGKCREKWARPTPDKNKLATIYYKPPTPSERKEDLFRLSNLAIESYNSKHLTNQFELVDPLHFTTSYHSWLFTTSGPHDRHHLSFIARSKGDSSLKLFFAQVSLADDTVQKCIIVEPGNPLFEIGCIDCHPDGVIYHPADQYSVWYGWDPFGAGRQRPRPLGYESPQNSAKRFLSEAYTINSKIEELNSEDADELRRTIAEYAVKASRRYNFEHGTSFEPLEIVTSVRFGFVHELYAEKLWAHFIFKALNKDHSFTNASPEYFFGEYSLQREMVTTCVMIENYSDSTHSGTETDCAVCREHFPRMFHPGNEMRYLAGRRGGNFCDSLDGNRSWALKSKLELKDGDSSNAIRSEYWKRTFQ